MVSKQTLKDLVAVLRRHVPDADRRDRLLVDLARVEGNRSFTDTVSALRQEDAGQEHDDGTN